MMYSAKEFSLAGDKYLGRPYSEMDCQAFVERAMRDVGYKRDLAGSNAWFRAMDWTGSPEECMREFGCVPTGALLYILKQDGREPEKYKKDGIGNASHIGIVTHRNDGAIHSSSSKGCVCTSAFKDKTVQNGGWNRIGLLKVFDYGKSVNWILEHGQSPADPGGEETPMQGKVAAESGSTVNLRKEPSTSAALVDKIPVGTEIDIIEYGTDWCRVEALGKTGWMMTQFIQMDGEITPGEPEAPDPDGWVQLKVRYEDLAAAYPFIKTVCDQIVEQIGRG